MRKICMVVFNYYDIDSRVKRHADFIADTGWKVDIIALRSHFSQSVSRSSRITVHELPVEKLRGSFLRYIFQYVYFCFLTFFHLSCLHIKNRYDIIQINNLPDFLVFSALIPKLMGCPILLDMHEITPEFFLSKYNFTRKHPVVRFLTFLEHLCISFTDHVITVNESIRELLISRGIPSEKISTILDSADEKLFVPLQDNASTLSSTFVILYHGTLTKLYGIDTAIRAISHLPPEIQSKVEMRIAGEGPEEAHLKSLVATLGLDSSVKFLGNHPVDEMPTLINSCDAGICPTSENELTEYSLSTKLLEYVYMGKPTIASRLRTYQKYFDDSCLAYFTPGNDRECSERIILLLNSREMRNTLAVNAKKRYEKMSWNIVKDLYYTIVSSLSNDTGERLKERAS
ncbi:MAG: glycosyltransferase family 4 protein [Candidatus Xenobiia bacterium LiM19]